MDKIKNILHKTDGKEQEKEFTTQPINENQGVDPKTAHTQAAPGPAVPKDFNAEQEGTKEDRRAKAAAMNAGQQ